MIKNTELRIGSIVNASETGYYPVVVIAIEEYGIKYYYEGEKTGKSFEFIYPIPITPEILEKAGFKDLNEFKGTGADNVYLVSYKGKNITLWEDYKISYSEYIFTEWHNCRVRYLHQLQNLFFALTGEELMINL